MPTIEVLVSGSDAPNSKESKLDLNDAVFGVDFNESLVHQVVETYIDNQHARTKKQKTRSEVRGGGKKPWRQKGTGRARAGTIRSPIWRSGGVTFAARGVKRFKKLNKKMFRVAMRSIYSELLRQDRLTIIDNFQVEEPKTKTLVSKFKEFDLDNGLLIHDNLDVNLYLSARNIKNVIVLDAQEGASAVMDLIAARKVLVTKAAIKHIEEALV